MGFNDDGKQKLKQKQAHVQVQEEDDDYGLDTAQLAELSKQASASRTPRGNEERSGNGSVRGGEEEVNGERKSYTGNKQDSYHFARTNSAGLGDDREHEYIKAFNGTSTVNIQDQLYE